MTWTANNLKILIWEPEQSDSKLEWKKDIKEN